MYYDKYTLVSAVSKISKRDRNAALRKQHSNPLLKDRVKPINLLHEKKVGDSCDKSKRPSLDYGM